ncbi:MAG: branched-chain amino acid transaminase [Candidatus Micrarchaeota archaeon]|nr:branched-chain amino acid transaminase [Candidatus Micrarchaeota archaeon]
MSAHPTDTSRLKVWLDGKMMPYGEAVVPIMNHSLHYGSGIFEGVRGYETPRGTAIFRLDDHIRRFMGSAKIVRMPIPFKAKEISDAVVKVVKENRLGHCYIRPFGFYNDSQIGLSTLNKKASVYVYATNFGAYFGETKKRGVSCKISSMRRINSSILPSRAKGSGNYLNSIIANGEAKAAGFDEAILLSSDGHVAEGSGENIFLVVNGRLVAPDRGSDILLGITRDTIIKIAEATGLEVEERTVHKEELYTADEVFFTGTAAEVTPIVNIDGISIGSGDEGPITKMLAGKYSDIVTGKDRKFSDWLTYA